MPAAAAQLHLLARHGQVGEPAAGLGGAVGAVGGQVLGGDLGAQGLQLDLVVDLEAEADGGSLPARSQAPRKTTSASRWAKSRHSLGGAALGHHEWHVAWARPIRTRHQFRVGPVRPQLQDLSHFCLEAAASFMDMDMIVRGITWFCWGHRPGSDAVI